ncbi:hypothetical protein RA27_21135 [Ruegeria sp. ANG-R]|uniref:hypothetical protein n=1 Tax=Ruegeria sp. ANG-R TaxID=1577903 RepID=UPI00057E9028|nr:hypothetical protein [Ruegeria sp. ANG-R]KIC37656.1 hypothetical protein RA27_21135 [Ruegeria sp. ANG-R]
MALLAALGFVVLASLHIARPVSSPSDPVLLGFAPGDICGFGETSADESKCPICTMAESGVTLSEAPALESFSAKCVSLLIPTQAAMVPFGATKAYYARAPPLDGVKL